MAILVELTDNKNKTYKKIFGQKVGMVLALEVGYAGELVGASLESD